MSFCWSTIRVNDLEESLDFYQKIVGLKLNRRFEAGPESEIAFLGAGETKIELMDDGASDEVDIGQDISLGFEVDSLDEKLEFIKEKGIPVHSGPVQPNPNIKFFFIQDPNGLKIQFVEHI